jgi:hypothetical protein
MYNLIDPVRSTKDMIHCYVVEQLVHLPGGTKMFDRLCVSAYSVIFEALVGGNILLQETLPVLYTSLKMVSSDKLKERLFNNRVQLVAVTLRDLKRDRAHRHLPDEHIIAGSTKHQPLYPPLIFTRATIQSIQSYNEQQAGFRIACDKMNKYLGASLTMVKSFCIVGGPGVGKTALMKMILLKAILNGMLKTLMLEWAFQLGGIHLHKLLLLLVRKKGTVQCLAELALISIYKSPEAMLTLMTLDVLFIDELGQWSDGYIAVIDIILRRVRGSNAFFGGVLVFATMDWKQLKPISGLPAMLSPSMITSFTFLDLGHSVRARGDPNLQQIQKNSRMDSPNYTPEIIDEFKQLLCTSCTFVSDWDHPILEQSVIWVFGLHDAVKHAEATMLQRIKDSNVAVLSCST